MLGPLFAALLVAHAAWTAPAGPRLPAAQQAIPPASVATPERPWPPAGVYRPGPEITSPRLVKEAKPNYVGAAMKAKIEGAVFIEAIVETDGTVGEVRVTRSLDREFGLDDEAVRTVKKWQFNPGKKDGVAVPVVIEVEMTFTLWKKSRWAR